MVIMIPYRQTIETRFSEFLFLLMVRYIVTGCFTQQFTVLLYYVIPFYY